MYCQLDGHWLIVQCLTEDSLVTFILAMSDILCHILSLLRGSYSLLSRGRNSTNPAKANQPYAVCAAEMAATVDVLVGLLLWSLFAIEYVCSFYTYRYLTM